MTIVPMMRTSFLSNLGPPTAEVVDPPGKESPPPRPHRPEVWGPDSGPYKFRPCLGGVLSMGPQMVYGRK